MTTDLGVLPAINLPAPERLPARDLAQGFADHVVQWAHRLGAPADSVAAVRDAAVRLSLALADGHVCLPLAACDGGPAEGLAAAGVPPDERLARLRERLLASGVVLEAAGGAGVGTAVGVGGGVGVGRATQAHPLLLDAAGRLYLRRHFFWERRLAAALMGMAASPPLAFDEAAVRGPFRALFPARAAGAEGTAGAEAADATDSDVDWQALAVALALQRRLTVISGGPGTGKTTTVAALLACLFADADARGYPLTVALAAPTGKAAARMLEALQKRAAGLPAGLRERMPTQAHTLHRLLGVTRDPGRFRHHAGNPLALDVLVVDEASMLDLALAVRLLEALPAHARLILLGDQDQLAAVEAGAVFAELSADPRLSDACRARLAALCGIAPAAICPAPPRQATPLYDSVVWLTRSHRFARDSGIGRLAAAINAGDAAALLAWLRSPADGAASTVRWLDDAEAPRADRRAQSAALPAALADALRQGYAGYAAAVREQVSALAAPRGEAHGATASPAAVFAAFERFRVLCAVHDGPRGVAALNGWLGRELQRQLVPPGATPASGAWYAGRAVIVLRNDYVSGLFNGDVGICLPDARGELLVWFAAGEAGRPWRAVAPMRLPAHDTAFAMTVHKSQGSEFAEVLVVLPNHASRVVTRELLYTAVTRAAGRVTLSSPATVLAAACEAPTVRHSGLTARMREAASQPEGDGGGGV